MCLYVYNVRFYKLHIAYLISFGVMVYSIEDIFAVIKIKASFSEHKYQYDCS